MILGSLFAFALASPVPVSGTGSVSGTGPNASVVAAAIQSDAERWARGETLWSEGRRLAALEVFDDLIREHGIVPDRRADATWTPLVERAALGRLLVAHYRRAEELARSLPPERGKRILGRALYGLARFEEALVHLDVTLPDEVLLVVDAATALGRTERAAAALVAAEQVLGDDDPRILAARGAALARSGDDAAAARAFERALIGDPLSAKALFGLGRALLRLGRRDEGLVVLERHRELVPLLDALEFARASADLDLTHASNRAALGDAHRALAGYDPRELDRAEDCYRVAAALASDSEIVTAIALRHARLLALDREQPEAAVAILRAALERARDVRLLVRIGDVEFEAGHPGAALAAYDEALLERPGERPIEARRARARAALEAISRGSTDDER